MKSLKECAFENVTFAEGVNILRNHPFALDILFSFLGKEERDFTKRNLFLKLAKLCKTEDRYRLINAIEGRFDIDSDEKWERHLDALCNNILWEYGYKYQLLVCDDDDFYEENEDYLDITNDDIAMEYYENEGFISDYFKPGLQLVPYEQLKGKRLFRVPILGNLPENNCIGTHMIMNISTWEKIWDDDDDGAIPGEWRYWYWEDPHIWLDPEEDPKNFYKLNEVRQRLTEIMEEREEILEEREEILEEEIYKEKEERTDKEKEKEKDERMNKEKKLSLSLPFFFKKKQEREIEMHIYKQVLSYIKTFCLDKDIPWGVKIGSKWGKDRYKLFESWDSLIENVPILLSEHSMGIYDKPKFGFRTDSPDDPCDINLITILMQDKKTVVHASFDFTKISMFPHERNRMFY